MDIDADKGGIDLPDDTRIAAAAKNKIDSS